MKFFQRRSRPSVRNLFAESQTWQMHFNFSPLQNGQTYVPKCLSATSPSHILTGGDEEEVEDFSADCWLQDHLHQFGNGITQLVTSSYNRPHIEYSDDSQTYSGSDVSAEVDENDNLMSEDLDNTYEYEYCPLLQNFPPATISHYTMVQEAPPNGFEEPPPSYEEAVQISFSSPNILTNWDVLF